MKLHDPDPDGRLRRERRDERAPSRPRRGPLHRLLRWSVALVALALLASIVFVGALRWIAPPTSAFMIRERVLALIERRPAPELRHEWVGWSRISAYAALAAVAAEDQRFPEHRGFDVEAIRAAWSAYRAGGRLRGASTISQQVAKNLFLWPGKSFLRKGLEAYFTVLIETLWPKRRILEVYLNLAEFGDGFYGVEAASRRFFDKPAATLEPAEAALLAAVLPNPRRFDADQPSTWVLKRRDWILRQMRQLGGVGYLARL